MTDAQSLPTELGTAHDAQLSIVLVATDNDAAGLTDALASIELACAGLRAEVIVVHGGVHSCDDVTARHRGLPLSVVRAPASSLVPVMWGRGAKVASGRVVAFTTTQMRVSPSWARALIEHLSGPAVGVGGPIHLAPWMSGTEAAGCLVRFSAFLPLFSDNEPGGRHVEDIPGDNAGYLRDAVLREVDLLDRGFWEVDFHRRFHDSGRTLLMIPAAGATFVGPVRVRQLLRQRFEHAHEFGRSRVSANGATRALRILASPLVPLVLVTRISRRAWRAGGFRSALLRALPTITLLAIAWAAGEAVGAARARTIVDHD